jgi:hypothetical protein
LVDWSKVRVFVGLALLGLVVFKLVVNGPAPPPALPAVTARHRELVKRGVEEYLARGVIA